jgi:hypothetical protein
MKSIAELVLQRTARLPVSRQQIQRLILACKRAKKQGGMREVIYLVNDFVASQPPPRLQQQRNRIVFY